MTRLFLTLKQNRFEVIGAVLVCLGFVAAALYEAWQLSSIVLPANCSPDYGSVFGTASTAVPTTADACDKARSAFNAIRFGTLMHIVQIGLIFAPFLVSILLGAPLVAREIEQGTAPLSWALAGSRRRWFLARLGALLVILLPLLLAVGLAGDLLYGASYPGTSPWASFQDYGLRGVLVLFWGLAAFTGTVALGTIFGRSLPAIFLALIICLFARLGGEYYFQKVLLAPYEGPLMTWEQVTSPSGWVSNMTDLTLDWRMYLDGRPFDGDPGQWYAEHTPPPELRAPQGDTGGVAVALPTSPNAGSTANPGASPNAGPSPSPGASPTAEGPGENPGPIIWGPQSMPYGLRGNQYWPVVLAEAAVLLAGSLFLLAIPLFWIGRRRPY